MTVIHDFFESAPDGSFAGFASDVPARSAVLERAARCLYPVCNQLRVPTSESLLPVNYFRIGQHSYEQMEHVLGARRYRRSAGAQESTGAATSERAGHKARVRRLPAETEKEQTS